MVSFHRSLAVGPWRVLGGGSERGLSRVRCSSGYGHGVGRYVEFTGLRVLIRVQGLG